MPTDHRERLARIRRFDQLVAYLRDELGWPIGSGSFEDLTFEYTAEELGIDAKNAAKIQEIKRLRPLVPGQPWGIFFVKFEPKRLPVVALRRILSKVVLKKRASANTSERQAWAADDLLFVSNYGEGEGRHIALAHFSKPEDGRDLPTLKVLGWDNLDTPLHLDAVARELNDHLAWPDDEENGDDWRARWRGAFKLHHRETITTSKQLSERLAELARAIRDRIRTALSIETDAGQLTKLMKAFQTALVHDLDEGGFADMYAQTITYGLLSARITDPARRTADDLAAHMRTNPFLRELMETFLHIGGRRGKAGGPGIDFDELGVSEVVELLDQANMEAVVDDFGDRNPQEDPVIHFYEHFLAAYDRKQKVSRGVFYTPRPVVSYIVRSVDELLRTEFGLTDGLADTTSWGEMAERHKDLRIPENTSPQEAFVHVLDPATGTGTFLVEVIDLIHKTLVRRWKRQGHSEKKIQALWNEYVPNHLLPRLHGYELLMAPYAIAHLKIGLKLSETGYHFQSDERARVYLTNALEPPGEEQLPLGFLPALAHEAEAVSQIKRKQQFTVVIGNPPYSVISSNLTDTARSIVDAYRFVDGQKIIERSMLRLEMHLQDDYIKFFRICEEAILASRVGVVGLISNSSYLDSLSLRGMRQSVLTTFPRTTILDLHGSQQRATDESRARNDQNVFDIAQGVAVFLGVSDPRETPGGRSYLQIVNTRSSKYAWLNSHSSMTATWESYDPRPPTYYLVPRDSDIQDEFECGLPLTEIWEENITGMVTAHDRLVIGFGEDRLRKITSDLRSRNLDDESIRAKWSVRDNAGWKLAKARAKLRATRDGDDWYCDIDYRPFDRRRINYHPALVWSDRRRLMKHLLNGTNISLVSPRQLSARPWRHVFVCRGLVESATVSNKSREICYVFPLWLNHLEIGMGRSERVSNLSSRAARLSNMLPGGGPEGVLHLAYAELHSRSYRRRYAQMLEKEFARLFVPATNLMATTLEQLGADLVALHLLEDDYPHASWNQPGTTNPNPFARPITTYRDEGDREVRRAGERRKAMAPSEMGEGFGRVYINDTAYFDGVPSNVWDFHVGSYQVCHKWLKDRRGRSLSDEDIGHYQKVVVALNETRRIMAEVDEVIKAHGGWPDAFESARAEERPVLLSVAESAAPYDEGGDNEIRDRL